MQRSSFFGLSEDQTTWAVFILWVIFNHFGIYKYIPHFLHANTTNNALVNGMFGELELSASIFSSDFVNQGHAPFRPAQ